MFRVTHYHTLSPKTGSVAVSSVVYHTQVEVDVEVAGLTLDACFSDLWYYLTAQAGHTVLVEQLA